MKLLCFVANFAAASLWWWVFIGSRDGGDYLTACFFTGAATIWALSIVKESS